MSSQRLAHHLLSAVLLLSGYGGTTAAATLEVNDASALEQALNRARAGDEVVILPGRYRLGRFESRRGGTVEAPIRVVARPPQQATIEAWREETFSIYHPHWQFEDLVIEGNAGTEHAFHLSKNADDIIIRRNRLIDFHSHIKVNGNNGAFPDHGLIEGNQLYNRAPRATDAPVTPIDVVGGKGWIIRDNTVRDFGGGRPNQIAYGMFLKGNSRNGLIERNLVICSEQHQGGWRLGISLGGGGTGSAYCEQQDCRFEHRSGVIRNNVVLNCSDAGIYLKRAADTLIEHNTLLLTRGIDVQLAPSSAVIRHNLLDGVIEARKGGVVLEADDNIVGSWGLFSRIEVAANSLAHRISDYPAKYPSVFSTGFIAWLQRTIRATGRWLSDSPFGLGHNDTLKQFPLLAYGNLQPAEPERLWRANPSPTVPDDFWARARSTDGLYVGAIDLGHSPCDITIRLRQRNPLGEPRCLSNQ